jgi:hypothetical protein
MVDTMDTDVDPANLGATVQVHSLDRKRSETKTYHSLTEIECHEILGRADRLRGRRLTKLLKAKQSTA